MRRVNTDRPMMVPTPFTRQTTVKQRQIHEKRKELNEKTKDASMRT